MRRRVPCTTRRKKTQSSENGERYWDEKTTSEELGKQKEEETPRELQRSARLEICLVGLQPGVGGRGEEGAKGAWEGAGEVGGIGAEHPQPRAWLVVSKVITERGIKCSLL